MARSKRVLVTTASFALLAMLIAPILIGAAFTLLNGWAGSFSEFIFYVWDMILSLAEHVVTLAVIMGASGLLAAVTGLYFGLMYQKIKFVWLFISTCVFGAFISVAMWLLMLSMLIEFRLSDLHIIMSAMCWVALVGFVCSAIICVIFTPFHYKGKL